MTTLRTWLLFCLVWSTLAAPARTAEPAATLTADIGPRPVAEALAAFGRQTGLQLIYVATIADAQQSRGARAGLTVSEALAQLLEGTGLRFEFLNARTVRVYAAPKIVPAVLQAMAVGGYNAVPHTAFPVTLDEVLVTASRRQEQASRVPISMAVWSQETMEASGVKSMADLGSLTPAVEFDFFPDDGAGIFTNIAIRGINDRNGTTVGVFLDDTAVPAPGNWGGAFGRAFPLVFDLDHVEVLRGPQGTLLGEGTEAGAIRFIMNQPSLETSTGLVRAELSTTERGGFNYELGAAAGGPLVPDVLGFRASAWRRSDGGFVDRVDPFTGRIVDDKANRSLSKSFRGALTIAPAANLRITPTASYQSVDINDSSSFYTYLSNPGSGKLNNGKLLRQPVHDTFYLGSLKLTAALDKADFSIVSSYLTRMATATVDATNNSAYGGWGNPLGAEYPVSYADAIAVPIDVRQNVFALEARLTSTGLNASLNWLVGVLLSRAHNSDMGNTVAVGMEEWGPLVSFDAFRTEQTQTAGYGQVGIGITKRIAADVGLRITRASYQSTSGDMNAEAGETTATPRFVLSYQINERSLVYTTVAKGYRLGGVNLTSPDIGCKAPPGSYAPDSLWSYEVGAKNRLFGERVQLDVSAFHISWSNLQQLLAPNHADTPCGYIGNAGDATSNGFDLTARALLTERVKLGVTSAYTDAHYTQTVKVGDAVIVDKGDALGALPIVPSPWHLVASVDYTVHLGSGIVVNARAEDVFHSRNPGPFTSDNPASLLYAPDRRPDASTYVLNLRANVTWSHMDMALFVNNALDSQPTVLRRNRCCFDTLFYATTFRPRTVGLSGTWRF
jgi:iron complex outermembrane receptor protein